MNRQKSYLLMIGTMCREVAGVALDFKKRRRRKMSIERRAKVRNAFNTAGRDRRSPHHSLDLGRVQSMGPMSFLCRLA
jgi:hypothetical protein